MNLEAAAIRTRRIRNARRYHSTSRKLSSQSSAAVANRDNEDTSSDLLISNPSTYPKPVSFGGLGLGATKFAKSTTSSGALGKWAKSKPIPAAATLPPIPSPHTSSETKTNADPTISQQETSQPQPPSFPERPTKSTFSPSNVQAQSQNIQHDLAPDLPFHARNKDEARIEGSSAIKQSLYGTFVTNSTVTKPDPPQIFPQSSPAQAQNHNFRPHQKDLHSSPATERIANIKEALKAPVFSSPSSFNIGSPKSINNLLSQFSKKPAVPLTPIPLTNRWARPSAKPSAESQTPNQTSVITTPAIKISKPPNLSTADPADIEHVSVSHRDTNIEVQPTIETLPLIPNIENNESVIGEQRISEPETSSSGMNSFSFATTISEPELESVTPVPTKMIWAEMVKKRSASLPAEIAKKQAAVPNTGSGKWSRAGIAETPMSNPAISEESPAPQLVSFMDRKKLNRIMTGKAQVNVRPMTNEEYTHPRVVSLS